MEPTEAKVRYVIHSKVLAVKWQNHPDGYHVHLEGSRESLNLGIDPPPWSVGDKIKITLEKV